MWRNQKHFIIYYVVLQEDLLQHYSLRQLIEIQKYKYRANRTPNSLNCSFFLLQQLNHFCVLHS